MLSVHRKLSILERFDCGFFPRSEWISRDDDVTMVFALNQIAAAILIFSGNALRYVNCGCLPSAVQSFTKISVEFRHIVEFLYKRFNFKLNTGLIKCKQICYLLDVSGIFSHSFFIALDPRRTQHIILGVLWYTRVTFCCTDFVVRLHFLRHLE